MMSVHRRDANSAGRKSEWKAFTAILLLLVMGALFGAFVAAPLRWANDLDFFGRQCFAAFLCSAIAAFTGTLLLAGFLSLTRWFRKKSRLMSERKKRDRS